MLELASASDTYRETADAAEAADPTPADDETADDETADDAEVADPTAADGETADAAEATTEPGAEPAAATAEAEPAPPGDDDASTGNPEKASDSKPAKPAKPPSDLRCFPERIGWSTSVGWEPTWEVKMLAINDNQRVRVITRVEVVTATGSLVVGFVDKKVLRSGQPLTFRAYFTLTEEQAPPRKLGLRTDDGAVVIMSF
jgi:hypothetical protein